MILTAKSDERDRIAGLEAGGRRLCDQAVQPPGAGPSGPGGPAPGQSRRPTRRAPPRTGTASWSSTRTVTGSRSTAAVVDADPDRVGHPGRLARVPGPRVLPLRADQPGSRLRVRGLRAHHRLPREELAPQDRSRPIGPRRSCRPCSGAGYRLGLQPGRIGHVRPARGLGPLGIRYRRRFRRGGPGCGQPSSPTAVLDRRSGRREPTSGRDRPGARQPARWPRLSSSARYQSETAGQNADMQSCRSARRQRRGWARFGR